MSGIQQWRRNEASIKRAAAEFEAERKAERDAQFAAIRQAERDRVRFTREDVEGATWVRLYQRRGWFAVIDVNAKSVTVWDVDLAGKPEKVRHPFSRVLEAKP